MDDTTIVKGLKQGDEQTIRYFVRKYQDKIYATCLSFIRNQTDAADITQEVFIHALQAIHSFNQQAQLSTWLYRIAVNKALNFIRDNKKHQGHQPLTALENHYNNNSASSLENHDVKRALDQAIEALPEKQKKVFVLSKLQELSYKEICSLTGLSCSSVESLLHRAKKNLQHTLQHFYDENFK